jgi:nitrous oxidase accessory protein NosD
MIRTPVILSAVCTALVALASPVSAYQKGKTVHISPGQSIQAALNTACTGDTIVVEAGTYAEQLSITKNGITLIGKDAIIVPPEIPVTNPCSGLAGTATNPDTGVTTVRQAGICIAGSSIVYVDQPFDGQHKRVSTVGTRVKDVKVSGFTVVGFNGLNIAILGAVDASIKDNIVSQGETYGMLTVASKHTDIKHNTITPGGFIGICMDDISDVEISENDVSGYQIGICVQTHKANIHDNIVHGCCVGAFVDPNIKGASIYANHFSNTAGWCNPTYGVAGIMLQGAIDTTVRGNSFENISFQPGAKAVGVLVIDQEDDQGHVITYSKGNEVQRNNFVGNDLDIGLFSKGPGNVAKRNTCHSSWPEGLC